METCGRSLEWFPARLSSNVFAWFICAMAISTTTWTRLPGWMMDDHTTMGWIHIFHVFISPGAKELLRQVNHQPRCHGSRVGSMVPTKIQQLATPTINHNIHNYHKKLSKMISFHCLIVHFERLRNPSYLCWGEAQDDWSPMQAIAAYRPSLCRWAAWMATVGWDLDDFHVLWFVQSHRSHSVVEG
jgi:hypothetical protein